MSIFNYFANLSLNSDQHEAISKLEDFISGDQEIFILKGYAGSGKTTILKGVVDYLNGQKINSLLMAPTGRAAKVLRDKVGEAFTIHKTIYNLSAIEHITDNDDAGKSIKYRFPLDESPVNSVLIIDEASMISSMPSNHELFSFGTGVLMDDLLSFSKLPNSGNKIIFVGDPAQLPPVGDPNSYALDHKYFINKGFKVEKIILSQVMRQKENCILSNATAIRDLLNNEKRNQLQFEYDNDSFVKIDNADIPKKFVEENPIPEIGGGIIICFSNAQALNYNHAIREKLYSGNKELVPGDLLIIGNNNYHSFATELMNGDMVKVMEVKNEVIYRNNIPVYDTINGERVKKQINLAFRKIKIRPENFHSEITCYIIDSLLNSPQRDLTVLEMKALYVDFVMRFNNEQERKKEQGLPHYKEGSEEFKLSLKQDPLYNSLRVKYSYAITCHKAQGGEWDTIFVDYYGRTSLKDDPLKWSYTATTRAIKKCFAANAPHISDFTHFKILQIGSLSNIPSDYFDVSQVPVSPFHKSEDALVKSMKYWEVADKLKNTNYEIKSITTTPYMERYKILHHDEIITADGIHNRAGIFRNFKILDTRMEKADSELLTLLDAPYYQVFNINYRPKTKGLAKLYSMMQVACEDIGITITNVVEKSNNYLVYYYLKTEAEAALIQFYWNKYNQITRAMPKSTSCMVDKKLSDLLVRLHSMTKQITEEKSN